MAEKKKTGRRKHSNFWKVRVQRVGLTETRAASILGVSIEEIMRWDYEGAPLMAERLLLMWDRSAVGVPGWDGFRFSRGVLIYRGRRWRPETLLLDDWIGTESLNLRRDLERLYSWRGALHIVRQLIQKGRYLPS